VAKNMTFGKIWNGGLAEVFIITGFNRTLAHLLQNTSLPQLLSSVDIFLWQHVDDRSYDDTVQWFVDTCQMQHCVTAERSASVAQVLMYVLI